MALTLPLKHVRTVSYILQKKRMVNYPYWVNRFAKPLLQSYLRFSGSYISWDILISLNYISEKIGIIITRSSFLFQTPLDHPLGNRSTRTTPWSPVDYSESLGYWPRSWALTKAMPVSCCTSRKVRKPRPPKNHASNTFGFMWIDLVGWSNCALRAAVCISCLVPGE